MIRGQPHGWSQQQALLAEQSDMDVDSDLPGAMPITIDLSTEADDDEGDLYELYGAQIPPPYTQHEPYGQHQPVSTGPPSPTSSLAAATSVGRLQVKGIVWRVS